MLDLSDDIALDLNPPDGSFKDFEYFT